MRKKSSIRDGRHGRLTRAVVIFFLLYTGADITLPQYFCPDEFGGRIASPTRSTGGAQKGQLAAAVDASHDVPSETPPEQTPHEEDCFCCCAHVLPGTNLARAELNELNSTPSVIESDSLPSPPVREMFRPPRLA